MTGKIFKRNLFVSIFAFLTVVSMALFFNLYEPWKPIGLELIPDGSFSSPSATNEWSGWNPWTQLTPDGGFNGSPGVVLTCSPKDHGILRFTTYDLTNIPAFRVSIRAAAKGVVRGKEGYHIPRVIFFYQNEKAQSLFNLHHGLMDISKDTGWKRYKGFFPVPQDAVNARLHIQNLGIAGTMHIDDVSIVPVRERPSAPWWKLFFGTLWMTAFGLCLFALHPWRRHYGAAITITLLLIMTGIVLPGKFLDDTIEKSIQTVKKLYPKPVLIAPAVQTNPLEKTVAAKPPASRSARPKAEPPATGVEQTHMIGHFTVFSLLAFLAALSWLNAPPLLKRAGLLFAGLVFFSAATEVLQFIPPDRSACLNDLYVDAGGMAGAVVLVFLLRRIQHVIRP